MHVTPHGPPFPALTYIFTFRRRSTCLGHVQRGVSCVRSARGCLPFSRIDYDIPMLIPLLTSLSSHEENTWLQERNSQRSPCLRHKEILTFSVPPKLVSWNREEADPRLESTVFCLLRGATAKVRPRPPHSERPGVWPHLYTRVTHRVTCPASTARQGSDCCSVREGGAGGRAGGRATRQTGKGVAGRTASAGISLPRPPARTNHVPTLCRVIELP